LGCVNALFYLRGDSWFLSGPYLCSECTSPSCLYFYAGASSGPLFRTPYECPDFFFPLCCGASHNFRLSWIRLIHISSWSLTRFSISAIFYSPRITTMLFNICGSATDPFEFPIIVSRIFFLFGLIQLIFFIVFPGCCFFMADRTVFLPLRRSSSFSAQFSPECVFRPRLCIVYSFLTFHPKCSFMSRHMIFSEFQPLQIINESSVREPPCVKRLFHLGAVFNSLWHTLHVVDLL